MTNNERKEFWEMLCSLPGTDLKTESEMLMQAIKYPKFLYRYRTVSTKSLEALRTNKLYFSTANYYDDPFDTFLNININEIRNVLLDMLKTPEQVNVAVDTIKFLLNGILNEEQKKQITADNIIKMLSQELFDSFLKFAVSLRNEAKKDIWSVCFSENGINEVLWLKYADQYKGFVQIYDLENDKNFLCGKQEKCKACNLRQAFTSLYPIYYSNVPYDATNYAKYVVLQKMEEQAKITFPSRLYEMMGTGFWERERITLIKKECHQYDEEWRMIFACKSKSPIMREWIPSGIILGLRMDPIEENLVISMAKEAGIKEIFKSYIDLNNKLNISLLPT